MARMLVQKPVQEVRAYDPVAAGNARFFTAVTMVDNPYDMAKK